MNAAGINVLYLTLDPETALCETNVNGKDYATIASYRVKEPLRVLDLTAIKAMPLPSVFDEDNRHNRSAILFLQKFADSISQKRSNHDIDIDYVPTQIVTEFFRYVKTSEKKSYNGILYESTQNPNGKCLALFLTRDEVLDEKYGLHILPNATTYYKKQYLEENNSSTKTAQAQLLIDINSNTSLSELPEPSVATKKRVDTILRKISDK